MRLSRFRSPRRFPHVRVDFEQIAQKLTGTEPLRLFLSRGLPGHAPASRRSMIGSGLRSYGAGC
jgi:hypothetical protein